MNTKRLGTIIQKVKSSSDITFHNSSDLISFTSIAYFCGGVNGVKYENADF